MAFLPVVNNSTGNLVIGEANKTLTMIGNTPLTVGSRWQTYSYTQTWSGNTRYTVVPANSLSTYIPFLVVGTLSLNSAPWFIRYCFLWNSLQQNGDSRTTKDVLAFKHDGGSVTASVGNVTSFYGDGVAPLRVEFYYTFTSYGTWTHDFYRLGV